MRSLYILILVILCSCAEDKKMQQNVQVKPENALEVLEEEAKHIVSKGDTIEAKKVSLEGVAGDLTGAYELIEGKLYDLDLKTDIYYKSAIVFEKLSETDYGYYYTDKIKDFKPIGYYGIIRRQDNKFYNISICDEDDIEGYSKDNFTNGIFINSEVKIITSGDVLGMITYGGNFRKYMLYKKKKPQDKYYVSLVRELKSVQSDYKKFVLEYIKAKNYDKNKLEIEYIFNNGNWKTIHRHKEDYASFKINHNAYQDPNQETKFSNLDASFSAQFENPDFVAEINTTQTKGLPLIDDTNFDSFIDEDDVNDVDVKLLKLEEVYPDFYKEGHNYKAIGSYRIALSEYFYSVVVTLKKGDHEMETTLINYDLGGNIIDYQMVAYDEIAESMFRTQSKINKSKLIVDQVAWHQEPQIERFIYNITDEGKIDELDSIVLNNELSNMPMLFIALDELKLNLLNIKTEFVVSAEHPDNPDDIIIVIPEIVEEGDHYFELNNHILIVNSRSGGVMHKFSQNGITSDEVIIRDIKIDTGPYLVTENTHAFGILIHRLGTLKANPYENKNLELFIKSGETLNSILYNFDSMDYGGERVTDCEGEFTHNESILTPLTTKTNGFFDIKVEIMVTDTESFLDEDGICNATDKHSAQTKLLKYNGSEYKMVDL